MRHLFHVVAIEHDLRLVFLAAVICLFAAYTAMSLLARSRESTGGAMVGRYWLAGAAFVTGSGVWSTHFVAMLAYRPQMPIGYDIGLTALSVVIAISISWIGLAVAVRRPAWADFGGVIVGIAVGAMHYTGMAAVRVPGTLVYDSGHVVASIVSGAILGGLALRVAAAGTSVGRRAAAGSVLSAAICILHFTAMGAVSIEANPLIPMPKQVLAPEWLAVTIAAVTVLIVGLGLAGSVVDQHLAGRAIAESERLRHHVTELETTKRELETTTDQLRVSLDAAAAGNQAKSQFLATMSHELRTPLNAIIGFSELVASEAFGPLNNSRYKEYVTAIHDSGAHLLGLINDVLDVSKLDSGRLELSEDTVDLPDVARNAIAMLRTLAEQKDITVREEVEDGLPNLVVDRRRVRQVIINLLSNAMKFTPDGGEVRVRAFRDGERVTLAVVDTGIGIARKDVPKALEPFGQIDSSLSRRYEGSGLGLPLSKRLMELHGGTLEIESRVGVGTIVAVSFPAHRIVGAAARQTA